MPPVQAGTPMFQHFLPQIIIIGLIFYFIVIRPEKKKQKTHKDKLENLKKNDQIVTAGGVHGTIVNIKEKTVILRIDDSAKMEIDKDAVAVVKSTST